MAWAPPSETDVANMAVDVLDDMPIASLDEDTPVGRFLKRNFWRVFDEVLVSYPWYFAKGRAAITHDATAPAFGWKYRFVLPADCVRPLPPRADGMWGNLPVLHEVEGNYVLMDDPGPLKLVYVRREQNPALWHPLFSRILAMQLALYGAQNITGKSGYVDKARTLLQDAWDKATISDGLSAGTPEPQNRHEIVDIRGRGFPNAGGLIRYPSAT